VRALLVSKAFVVSEYRRKLTELARLGVEVTAVSPPAWPEGGRDRTLEPADGEDYRLIVSPIRWNGHFHLHYYPRLRAILHEVHPDLVHVDEEPYNLATFLAVRASYRQGTPSLFFTWQNIRRNYPPPYRQLERSVYRMARRAIAGSDQALAVLRAKGYAGPVSVVPQFGVDPDVFYPGEGKNEPFTVGFLNRFVPAKDPMLALRAFGALPDDARLVMVGEGPLRPAVEAAVASGGLSPRVAVRDRVRSAQVPDIMRSLDVAILPSRTTPTWKEQFGRVLIEAMACGVPVVATDSGEIPRVVANAGIVVPEGDAEALGGALLALYRDADLRKHLGRLGRERVLAHFTHARIAELTLQAYREALA
jgi:glycosyltransferase involved in cell wall biosynthesis